MSNRVEQLHKEMSTMSLGDLLLVAGQAINMGMDKERVGLILKYVEIAITKWRLKDGGE